MTCLDRGTVKEKKNTVVFHRHGFGFLNKRSHTFILYWALQIMYLAFSAELVPGWLGSMSLLE